jgi:hypothetical protein
MNFKLSFIIAAVGITILSSFAEAAPVPQDDDDVPAGTWWSTTSTCSGCIPRDRFFDDTLEETQE